MSEDAMTTDWATLAWLRTKCVRQYASTSF